MSPEGSNVYLVDFEAPKDVVDSVEELRAYNVPCSLQSRLRRKDTHTHVHTDTHI